MQTGHELFVLELNEILDGEHQLLKVLEENANDSAGEDLQDAFRKHFQETEGHVDRLRQCFELLDEQSHETECRGIRGLAEEKISFSKEEPTKDLIDVFNVEAGIKAESYEICSYESLIQMAREMKHAKVAQLLNRNLREEKTAHKKMKDLSKKIRPAHMMTEQQAQKAGVRKAPSSRRHAA